MTIGLRESSLHNDGSVTEVIDKLKSLGVTYEKMEPFWFEGI